MTVSTVDFVVAPYGFRLHRSTCHAAGRHARPITERQAVGYLAAYDTAPCRVCAPDVALPTEAMLQSRVRVTLGRLRGAARAAAYADVARLPGAGDRGRAFVSAYNWLAETIGAAPVTYEATYRIMETGGILPPEPEDEP